MMPEKRELKRLEELAKKKKRLLLLQQRLLTDATLPSMEPTTSRRKSEISKDDSSPSQRLSRTSKSGAKTTPLRKRSALSRTSSPALGTEEVETIPTSSEKSSSLASSRDSSPRTGKRSSKTSEAHDMILENLAKKLKKATTSTVAKNVSAKKSSSKSRDNSPHQTKLKSKSRDCSPKQLTSKDPSTSSELKIKDESSGKKPRSRDPSPRIAKMKTSEAQSDVSTEIKDEKPTGNVLGKPGQKLSAVDSLTDQDTLMLLKPTIPEKVSSIPMAIGTQTDQQSGKKRGRKKKLKRLVQTAQRHVKKSVHSFQRGRPKGSKNKKWILNSVARTKLRRTVDPTPKKQPPRKRTLSGEFELIDERQLKKDMRKGSEETNDEDQEVLDSSNENIIIEESCEQLDFSDTEYEEDQLELVLEPSPTKTDGKRTPRKSSESMDESPAKVDPKQTLQKSDTPDGKQTPIKSPEIQKILSAKRKSEDTSESMESLPLKSENLETVSVGPETKEASIDESNTSKLELDPSDPSTSKAMETTENVSCETQCNLMYEKEESNEKKDGSTATEEKAKESPAKVEPSSSKRGRRPTSIIQTVTEIMVKPSGETTKIRTITTSSEKTSSVPELSSLDDSKETVSRNLFSLQDDDVESVKSVSSYSDASLSSNSKGPMGRTPSSLTKKKRKKEVFTYKHKRFTRKKKRKTDLLLINPTDTSLSTEDNGDIPVLSPTETQFPEAPNTDIPSPLLNMPVLMKEPLEKPSEIPAEATVEKPSEIPGETTAEEPSEIPTETTVEKPLEIHVETTTEKPSEIPIDKTAEKPVRKRGRPRIFPIKIPSGRGRGRPRKYLTDKDKVGPGSHEATGVIDPVLQTSISPSIAYSTVELDFGFDQEAKADDGTIIADVVNGLVNDVCRGLTKLKSKKDSIKQESGKIPLKIPLGPRLKGKKGHKRKGHQMQFKRAGPKHSKGRSLHNLDCTPIESLSWKVDNSVSPEGSTKLIFKRRKQTTSKSMSERENSLFLAEVEQLMREKEKSSTSVPSRARQFMLREKVSRSPLEILAMKDKLEEEEYEKSQIPKRKPRSKVKLEPLENVEECLPSTSKEPLQESPVPVPVPVKYNGPVKEMKSLCKPCHVPVINIVSYVNKHMEEGMETGDNSLSDEIDASDSDKSYVLTEEEQSEYDNDDDIFKSKFVMKKSEKAVPISKVVKEEVKSTIKIAEIKEDGYIASYVEFLKSQSEPPKAKIPKIAKVTPIMKTTTEKPPDSNSSTSSVGPSRNSSSLVTSSKTDAPSTSSTVSSSTGVVAPSARPSQQPVSNTSDSSASSSTPLYSCKSCDFSSPAKNQIENHIYTHISHVIFRCGSCNSQDRTLAAAQRHQTAAHPNSNQNIIKIPRVREEDYYRTETKANQPLYVSLVVQGNFSLNASSIRNQSNRFVCTHCQYSTNINEDIDQHILDLHKDQDLFVCTLCDRVMYHSRTEIQAHCQQTHPSRPDCFRKLPHFYDCELTDSSERGRSDSRGNIFDRMTNFFNPVQSSNDSSTDSDRIRCAKEYLNIQDSINRRASESGNASPSDGPIVQTPTVIEEVTESSTKAREIVEDTPKITEVIDVDLESASTPETINQTSSVNQTSKEHSIALSILQGKTVTDPQSTTEKPISNTSASQIASTSQGPDKSSLPTVEKTVQNQDNVNATMEQDTQKNSNVEDTVSKPKPSNEQPVAEEDNGLGGLKIISVVSLQGQELYSDSSSASKRELNSGSATFTASPLVIPRPNINVPPKQKLLLPKPSPTLLEKNPPKPKDILPKAPLSVDDIVLRNERLTCTYKCKTCNVHAPFLSVIVEHLMQHHKSICVFTCPYCKLSEGRKPDFKTETQAREHIAKHHPSYYAKKDTSLSDSAKEIVQVVAIPASADFQRGKTSNIERDIYMCQKCSTHMPSLSYMYSHIENEHDDVFLHVCPECKKYKHKSEDVVFKHVMDVHLKDPSSVDLSLAMEDNLFTRIFSISKNAVYSEKSHTVEDPSQKGGAKQLSDGENSRQSPAPSSAMPNVVKKRPTARKSIKRVDDIAEARALLNASANQNLRTPSPSSAANQPRPIFGSQLFTECTTDTTSSVTNSTTKAVTALVPVIVSQGPSALYRNQSLPTASSMVQTKQQQNYVQLSVEKNAQQAKQKHLPVGYKTVAQQLRERKLMQTAVYQQIQQSGDDRTTSSSSSPSLHQNERYLTPQQIESVQSKKFSMTDKLHRLHKPSASTTSTPSTPILNVPKPVLKVPSMDKIRSLSRPKSLPSASESSADMSMAQEMSNYPGILRPPAASSSSPRSQPVFPMNTAPKGPSPKPQPSLLFPRGLSPSPKLPVKSPVPIDADTDDPEAFKIFNLKPSKSPKPPQTSTPPVPNLKGPFPQLVNLPAGFQFPQINFAGQGGQIPNFFTQGLQGVVLLQPQALNNPAVVSPVNAFGVEPQGFSGMITFKCPYCSTVLERNAVQPHIEGKHKGCAVIYKPLGI